MRYLVDMTVSSDRARAESTLAWSQATVSQFRSSLLDFFGESARELPWRAAPDEAPDPYRVLVSEVMLQQTRVETVIPYFDEWMKRFPTPEVLSEAGIDDVLKVWQGLGYYSRARNLHGAVCEMVERYDGDLPRDPDALEALPGVGPYTAGAIASIAFGIAAPAVDGNVRRVLSRLMDHPSPTPSVLRLWASELVDPEHPGRFNQALMELGSLVCIPRDPSCDQCPVATFCAARSAGTQRERPAPRKRAPVPRMTEAVAILERTGGAEPAVLLRQRMDTGLLAGMWELPGRAVGGDEEPLKVARELAAEILRRLGVRHEPFIGKPEALSSLEHAFSHRKIRYVPFRFEMRPGSFTGESHRPRSGLRWVTAEELEDMAVPAAQRKLLVSATKLER